VHDADVNAVFIECRLPGPLADWPCQQAISTHGSATRFAYDEQQQLTQQVVPCYRAASSSDDGHQQQESQPRQMQGTGMVHQSFPDCMYAVQPGDLQQAITALGTTDVGGGSILFEAGVVLR
jgi:hypothetical protein